MKFIEQKNKHGQKVEWVISEHLKELSKMNTNVQGVITYEKKQIY